MDLIGVLVQGNIGVKAFVNYRSIGWSKKLNLVEGGMSMKVVGHGNNR
jgi:hypothetical protein